MGNHRRPHARRSGRHPVRPPRQATGPPRGGPDTPRRCAGGSGGLSGLPQPPRPAARRRPRQAAQQTRHGGPRKPGRICEQGRRRQPPTGPHTADVLTRYSAAKQAGGDGGTAARPPDLARRSHARRAGPWGAGVPPEPTAARGTSHPTTAKRARLCRGRETVRRTIPSRPCAASARRPPCRAVRHRARPSGSAGQRQRKKGPSRRTRYRNGPSAALARQPLAMLILSKNPAIVKGKLQVSCNRAEAALPPT